MKIILKKSNSCKQTGEFNSWFDMKMIRSQKLTCEVIWQSKSVIFI